MGRVGTWKQDDAEDRDAALRRRLFVLRLTILVAFGTGLLMSSALWIGPRSYPQAPVWTLLPPIQGVVATVLYGGLFALAGLAVVFPRARWPIAGFLAILIAFCLADQTRWQPWVFQYSFLLAVVGLSTAPVDDLRALNLARLVIVFTYVFSGLQKINLNFMEHEFPWIITPMTSLLPAMTTPLDALGFLVPFVQVVFGIGLLTRRFRRVSLAAAVGMHVFILAMFGPLGLNWNDIVWPWTAAMAVFDVLLFSSSGDFSWRDIVWDVQDLRHGAAVALFVVMPALSFFNLWDSYLSSALYSGNLTEAQIYLSDLGAASTPGGIRPYLVHTSENTNVLNLQRWAVGDLNVTPYAETRVFKDIARNVCDHLRDRDQLVLVVKEQRMFFSRPETGFRCSQL
ncbi:hypothetical protein G8O24_14700 [Bradyrhizobium sp. INPA01-394B]|uniref:DoxX family protein n=1 Tax=Bradyrhizobium campsiandrae TaxID=1729892 RepID=A0ABR7U9L7_9BRAD|nr:hypothetical protein [Bradyrhizobium campsiandrae]MBC9878591.1 hypothetical protein [Bradyrhizobium campsiandrae]MBC9980680.1 hypothetical protein [Bradyrhizobium campsiandrae]